MRQLGEEIVIVALGDDGNPQGPIFFLSYARARSPRTSLASPHDVNRHVVRFFDDLSMNVDQLVGSPTGVDPGYMDESLESGTKWDRELLAVLGTCHVFVPLISSRYVNNSKWCPMEWDAFSRRTARTIPGRPSDLSQSGTAILPVTWSPVQDQLPQTVQELQFFLPKRLKDRDIAERYRENGIFGLLATDDMDAYGKVAWSLARRIADVYYAYQVEPMILSDSGHLCDSFWGDGR